MLPSMRWVAQMKTAISTYHFLPCLLQNELLHEVTHIGLFHFFVLQNLKTVTILKPIRQPQPILVRKIVLEVASIPCREIKPAGINFCITHTIG